jgi:hypothetical protein
MKGVHGKDPTEYVMKTLEEVLRNDEKYSPEKLTIKVKKTLQKLGKDASEGFPDLNKGTT